MDTPGGVVILTREQLKAQVRADLSGLDLVGELLAERRQQAAIESGA
jgi:UDP-N-acetyl-D-mannosaminuronic acid transferase (WecB/TagA/CpsF family)